MAALLPAQLPWVRKSWLPKIQVVSHEELPDPCWLWSGCQTSDGYGQVKIAGKMIYLHRHAWAQANGEQLGATRDGHHRCYNRNCFQPAHIEATTRDENRGPTRFRIACPLADDELMALYDLYGYEMRRHGYVLPMERLSGLLVCSVAVAAE